MRDYGLVGNRILNIMKKSYLIIFLAAIITYLLGSYIVRDFKRVRETINTLDKITYFAKYSSNPGLFYTDSEKLTYLDSLKYYDSVLDLLSEVSSSDLIKDEISRTKKLISDQTLRVSRLNDFLVDPVEFSNKYEIEEDIHYQEPYTKDLLTLNFIFTCKQENLSDILAIQVFLYREDSVVYSKQYKPKNINSIVVPHIPNSSEVIELGYIKKDTFNYIKYNI
jgi:hypothetical protein